MEWMEMDARTVHSTGWTEWTVDVEWIATLDELISMFEEVEDIIAHSNTYP